MEKLNKLMLAAFAAVSVSGTAMAWDFKATGSVVADFQMNTEKAGKGKKTITTQKVDSEDGDISLISSHKDGDNSATFTYKLEWDDAIKESLTVAGSTKKGDWTASASTSFKRMVTKETTGQPDALQTDNGDALITLTNGTLTYKLGKGGHLGNAAKSEDSVATGKVLLSDDIKTNFFGEADDGVDIGAAVGDFDGFSVGYKVDDMTTVTFAYQLQTDASILGKQKAKDGELSGYQTTGMGLGADVSVAGANIAFTYASGSTKQNLKKTDNSTNSGRSTSLSTMGLGVDYTVAGAKIFFTYATSNAKTSKGKGKNDATGMILGAKYSLDADSSVVLNISNSSEKSVKERKMNGMELGYDTKVGPVSLGVGYGTQGITHKDDENDGFSGSYLKVKMSYSF